MIEKRYTAQEMRDFADAVAGDLSDNNYAQVEYGYDDLLPIIQSLRQAADAEDELVQLKDRMEAVVMECEKQIPSCRGENCKCNPTDSGYCDENCHDEIIVHTAVTAILRAARGEGGEK